MDLLKLNREAWNSEVRKGNEWTRPVSPEVIADAKWGNGVCFLPPLNRCQLSGTPSFVGRGCCALHRVEDSRDRSSPLLAPMLWFWTTLLRSLTRTG